MPTAIAPLAYTGAQIALFLTADEVPVSQMDVRIQTRNDPITGSTSVYGGKVWQEFSPGESGGTLNWQGYWRVGQTVSPPLVIPGETYAARAYIRRPLWSGIADLGSYYLGNIIIDDSSLRLDPKAGAMEWSVSAKWNGAVAMPG